LNEKRMEAYYNLDGEVIGTSTPITLEELPVKAKRTIAKKFEGYTFTEAIRFEGAEENAFYIFTQNDKETVILKVTDTDQVVTFKKTKK